MSNGSKRTWKELQNRNSGVTTADTTQYGKVSVGPGKLRNAEGLTGPKSARDIAILEGEHGGDSLSPSEIRALRRLLSENNQVTGPMSARDIAFLEKIAK